MVKSYCKYELTKTFGLVISNLSNIVCLPSQGSTTTGPGLAVVAANEEVIVWDVKKGEIAGRWRDTASNAQVTTIARSFADPDVFAIGYDDGSIRIWDSRIESVMISFNGHKSAVAALAFDSSRVRLASGSQDTDIVIWDLVAETGIVKLRGHKDQVVALSWIYPESADQDKDQDGEPANAAESSFILSASKDATLKLWDIESQHCLETRIAQTNGECWAMDMTPDGRGCVTAGNGGELKIWSIRLNGLAAAATTGNSPIDARLLHDRGVLLRQSKDRTTGVLFHPSAEYFAVYSSQKAVEIWRVRPEAEVQRMLQRRRKRKREKGTSGDKNDDVDMTLPSDDEPSITDHFTQHALVRTGGKISAIDWIRTKPGKSLQFLAGCSNNTLEVYEVPPHGSKSKSDEPSSYSRTFLLDVPGHRTDVRGLSLSSDDRMLATASNGLLKIWNVSTGACLRTLDCGYSLCCSFLPGDKIVVVGTKSGDVELFDISSSTLIESIQGHEGSVWALQVHPEGKSCVTGGADKLAKFWNFEIIQEDIPGTKRTTSRLKLAHSRSLKLNDDILSLCFSPDSRLLAVSTLDNTVKVFFTDSLKLFLNLYGHKLPVISMAISSDSKLIATSSADKNIRLWGLDFGDCHKALFGHNDSIMAVKFIPEPGPQDGHFLFSISKDRTIKTWDGDKFEQVQKLNGHHGEIWAMAISKTGEFFVTASHDKSIRVWSLANDLIFLEEEREREIEELYEQTLTTSLDAEDADSEEGAVAPTKQTAATLTAGEKIMEALELSVEDLKMVREWESQRSSNPKIAAPQRDPLFMALGNISAERHVLNTLARVPAAQLHDALLVLPFSALPALFTFIVIWVNKQWEIALVCRVLFFMLKTHQKQIVSSKELKATLEGIRHGLKSTLGEIKDVLGFNVAALQCIGDRVKEKGITTLEDVENDKSDGRKRAFVEIA